MPSAVEESKRIKVAYVTGEYPKSSHTFIQREIKALRKLGVSIDTFSVRRVASSELAGDEEQAEARSTTYILERRFAVVGDHVVLFFLSPWRYVNAFVFAQKNRGPGLRDFFYQFIYFLEAGVLAAALRRRKISHLHCHFEAACATVAMLSARLGAYTYSFTLHGPHIFNETKRWKLREKIHGASFVVCISHFARSQAMLHSDRHHWSKLHVLHCGIEVPRYSSSLTQRTGRNLVFIGRLAPEKGVFLLLAALANLRSEGMDLQLRVVGDGPMRMDLEREVSARGLRSSVLFLGIQSQNRVAEILRESDVLVAPSFAEGLPVVLMEAFASEVSVVATRVGGIAELVEDGVNGFLVEAGDQISLELKIKTLMRNPECRKEMSARGLDKVRREFNVHSEALKLKSLFVSLSESSV